MRKMARMAVIEWWAQDCVRRTCSLPQPVADRLCIEQPGLRGIYPRQEIEVVLAEKSRDLNSVRERIAAAGAFAKKQGIYAKPTFLHELVEKRLPMIPIAGGISAVMAGIFELGKIAVLLTLVPLGIYACLKIHDAARKEGHEAKIRRLWKENMRLEDEIGELEKVVFDL